MSKKTLNIPAAEEKWPEVFDAVKEMVMIVSPDNIFLDANKATLKVLGMSKKDLVGRKCYEIVHNSNEPHPECPCKKSLKTRKVGKGEVVENGHCYAASALPMMNSQKQIKSFVHVIEDITDKKNSEQALEKYHAEVETMNRIILESYSASDEEVLIKKVLHILMEFTGFEMGNYFTLRDEDTAEIAYTTGFPRVFIEGSRVRQRGDGGFFDRVFVNKKAVFTSDYPSLNRKLSASGKIRSLVSIPVFCKKKVVAAINLATGKEDRFTKELKTFLPNVGKEIGNVVEKLRTQRELAENVAALKEMNIRLKESQEQMVQTSKLAGLGTLAAGIAHEMNQPLMGISMVLEKLLYTSIRGTPERFLVKKKSAEGLEYILRIKRTIEHIRLFSREQKSELEVAFEVNKAVENALSLLGEQYRKSGIRISLDLDKGRPRVKGNLFKLEQVIINLLTNARDSIEENSKYKKKCRKTISIKSTVKSKQISISIKDNGKGIKPGNIKNIFDPFFSTKPAVKGTGLGLSVSHGIIEAMRGVISVKSTPGKGALFTITIPAAP